MIFNRAFSVFAGTVCAVTLAAWPAAAAAPVNAPDVREITATCPGGPVHVVVAPGQGEWTPAFIEGTHQVFIPYSFIFTVTDADGAVIDDETVAKAAEPPADAITCTYGEEFIEDGETFTFVGTVTGVIVDKP
jgi:hypothetical protein